MRNAKPPARRTASRTVPTAQGSLIEDDAAALRASADVQKQRGILLRLQSDLNVVE